MLNLFKISKNNLEYYANIMQSYNFSDYLCIDQDNVELGPTIDIQVYIYTNHYSQPYTVPLYYMRCARDLLIGSDMISVTSSI